MADIGRENLREQLAAELQTALSTSDLPSLYTNGFSITVGSGDVLILLKRNNESIAVLNLSFTLAKTLAEKLGFSIAFLEEQTGNTIMTTDDIGERLEQHVNQK